MPFEPLVKTGRPLSGEEVTRYARHVLIPGVGREGQERLAAARVLVVGAGGLGSPALLYLAAAGVGTIGVVDADVVELTNLHRQVIHSDADLGRLKTESAEAAVARVNPHVAVVRHDVTLDSGNALDIIRDYDLVVDGTDNFPTRYLVNDACVLLGKPHVWGSILRFDGQVSIWWRGHGPCYRCVFPEPPPPGAVPSCAEGGVFGILCAAIGSVQSTEAIKLLLGLGDPLTGRLLVHDALRQSWDTLTVRADPECPVCGENPSITELIDYVEFCGVPGAPTVGEGSIPEVSVRQMADELAGSRPPLLVDVRGPQERAIASIPGAVPIHLDRFRSGAAWDELPRDRRVLIHCKVGGRSAEATRLAMRAGYVDVANVAGGVIAYLREIDSSQPEY
ncbi:molybdopterin-synthase adenylyltransferase MoeB [Intrasporangium calvum]|uniref:UBA/THIF-type NAD/FAD binding protein n=1 Tax=Intrasporangium calvum (strain ATCC 23552 / DSM 43043 / JCM 3097 / NBRC 12989 / NCIMB 10167 / NRRL B-3866 / 7 KIP) TaxID=710696 RepID=E6S7X0_INTC7|nr:molybdopterin-synthase adenylyltransferase MoeB [Intrasporangium calvum]ADU49066.1 UBA/THIF-type NAD/FAD binding protein [Intrasporangium calvum DSM 43043]AXG14023.1 molybdopterin-synthase adenylyltransferase MoeB [Intrasporangium calvum]